MELSEIEEGSTFQQTLQSQCGSVALRFVLGNGRTPETCPSIMLAAFQLCDEQSLEPEWISEADFLSFKDAGKTDVFVLDPFEGPALEHASMLCNSKAVRVIGPRCLTYCFMHKLPIPEYVHPMHNMAMHGVTITCTGLGKELRERMRQLVQYMAGVYASDFNTQVTHLIADSVTSPKYRVAQEREIPVMKPSWVTAVWETMGGTSSQDDAVSATDHKFLSHVCPVFMKQCVCVSQLPKRDKIAIKYLVEENGGEYSPQLEMDKATLLVTTSMTSDKSKCAVMWKVPVVTPEYIYDSVQANYALDVGCYKLERDASTPTKDTKTKLLPPDVSVCSTIGNYSLAGGPNLDPTMSFNETLLMGVSASSITSTKIVTGTRALDDVSVADLTSKAGLFLDGCKVYLSGWAEASAAQGGRAEKLRKLLNAGGASRFNQLTENVTHVILGSFQGDTVSKIKTWSSKPHLVSAEWLVESAKAGRPVDEEPYDCFSYLAKEADLPSKKCTPLNDTTLELNPRNNTVAKSLDSGKRRRHSNDEGDNLPDAKKITSQSGDGERVSAELSRRDSCASSMLGTEVSLAPIFNGLTFALSGFEEEVCMDLERSLEKLGGRTMLPIMSSKGVDYCVVTSSGEGVFLPYAKHHVSHFFIEECTEVERVLEVQYYHLPLLLPSRVLAAQPLEGAVLTISVYAGRERHFLAQLAQNMGARVQEMFSRRDNPKKGVFGSTHLVCSEASGHKYEASVKWNIPAVTRDWLLMCAKEGTKVSESEYLTASPTAHSVDNLQIMKHFIEEHIEACTPPGNHLNDSSMIAPTPHPPSRVLSLRAESSATLTNRGGLHTTPGKPTTPSAVATPDIDTLRKLYPTPGRGGQNDHSMNAMPTPETPYGICFDPNPSKRTRKLFKKTTDTLPLGKVEEMHHRNEDLAKKMLDLVKCSKTAERLQALEFERDESVNGKAAPLSNCVIFVHGKIRDHFPHVESKVKDLGGRVAVSLDGSVTHVVYKGKADDVSSRDLKPARAAGCIIVSPDWVDACFVQKQCLEESLYPYTCNPNVSVEGAEENVSPQEKNSVQNLLNKTEDLTLENADDGDATQVYEEQQCGNGDATSTDLAKDLEELERLAADRETQTQSLDGHDAEYSAAISASLPRRRSSNFMKRASRADDDDEKAAVRNNVGTMEMPTSSQNTNIAWADPSDSAARRLLSASTAAEQSETCLVGDRTEVGDDNTFQAEPSDKTVSPPKPRYKFLISNMDSQKEKIEQVIIALGGEVDSNVYCVTHLITMTPSRSERLLAAIAAGKWVLGPSYITASLEQNSFVDEEDHEWGNPRSVDVVPRLQPGSVEEKLARAAYRWRQEVKCGRVEGAFSGWKVLVMTKSQRAQAFSRLLAAGDAEVYSESISDSNFPSDLTHCFVEMQHVPNFDLAVFAKKKVPCLDPVFIHESLVSSEPLDVFEHCIQQYQVIMANMTACEADKFPVKNT